MSVRLHVVSLRHLAAHVVERRRRDEVALGLHVPVHRDRGADFVVVAAAGGGTGVGDDVAVAVGEGMVHEGVVVVGVVVHDNVDSALDDDRGVNLGGQGAAEPGDEVRAGREGRGAGRALDGVARVVAARGVDPVQLVRLADGDIVAELEVVGLELLGSETRGVAEEAGGGTIRGVEARLGGGRSYSPSDLCSAPRWKCVLTWYMEPTVSTVGEGSLCVPR